MINNIELKAGENTHENILFVCFGGLSNTGITAALASLEVVKELGLKKVAIGCLGGLPTNIGPVLAKSKAAKKIITVDGCPHECARKITEQAGFHISKSIILTRDIDMKKKPLNEDINKNLKQLIEYIDNEEIIKAKKLIIEALENNK